MSSTRSTLQTIEAPLAFKEAIRTKILDAFIGLIPEDKLDQLISDEVSAFFDSDQAVIVQTRLQDRDSKALHPVGTNPWNGQRHRTLDEVTTFGCGMAPFRQLVWAELNNYIQPKITALFNDTASQVNKELDNFLSETAQAAVESTGKAMITNLSLGMSTVLLRETTRTAITVSSDHFKMVLQSQGYNTSNIPPVWATLPKNDLNASIHPLNTQI